MKLISYRHRNVDSYGLLTPDGVIDLSKRLGWIATTLKQCIATRSLERASAFAQEKPDIALSEIEFLPVIPDPQHIVCIGLNYEEHRAETARLVANHPTIFLRVAGSLQAHQRPLLIPRESDHFDYEGELALIIGRTARRIDEQTAWDYVAGVCCSNEGTVRDWQNHTHQFGPGKNFPFTGALGPALVTTDELPKNFDLSIETRVNAEVRQRSRTGQMIFCVPRLLAYISTFMSLQPGDVIFSGTPGGVGAKRKPPSWLRDGDLVEVEIERVGTLSNRCKKESV
jgi:2-keto-4-pentenoate hydratase/2-oxohepta-3-ene-1,7-dioic acid hydratase in catechol pathway